MYVGHKLLLSDRSYLCIVTFGALGRIDGMRAGSLGCHVSHSKGGPSDVMNHVMGAGFSRTKITINDGEGGNFQGHVGGTSMVMDHVMGQRFLIQDDHQYDDQHDGQQSGERSGFQDHVGGCGHRTCDGAGASGTR